MKTGPVSGTAECHALLTWLMIREDLSTHLGSGNDITIFVSNL